MNVYDEAHNLQTAIKESEEFRRFDAARQKLEQNPELKSMMDYFDRETDCESATVGGWVMEVLGCIPAVGEKFTADGLAVTVLKAESNHPEEILVTPIEPTEEAEE